jgi:hypothetical protein
VDRFAMENHNQMILARSGAGKSYLAKLQILRSLYGGIEVLFAHTDAALGLRANTSGCLKKPRTGEPAAGCPRASS